MARIEIVNWGKFQHYKHRSPPWVKLYHALHLKREWRELDGYAAKLLIDLWMLAGSGSSKEGFLEFSTADLAWQLRTDDIKALASGLMSLQGKGFIKLCQHDASMLIAPRQQVATPEYREEKSTELKDAGAKAPGVPPRVDNPEFPTVKEWLAHWMPMLRELAYECDQHDGSILKALFKKKLKPPEIEPAFRGLALMRDNGLLDRMGIGPEDKLSARIIYADQGDRPRPFWNECVEYWHQQQPKAKSGHGMKPMFAVIDGLRRQGA